MSIIETIKHRRKAARIRRETRFIINRDEGCVFCRRLTVGDDPFHRYLTPPNEQRTVETDCETQKKYAICEWHKKILWDWADADKQNEMLNYLREYLSRAQMPF